MFAQLLAAIMLNLFTITSALPTTTLVVSSPSPSMDSNDGGNIGDNTIALVAIVGGIVFLIILVIAIWWRYRQKIRLEELQLELQVQQLRVEQQRLQSGSTQPHGETIRDEKGEAGGDRKGDTMSISRVESPPPAYLNRRISYSKPMNRRYGDGVALETLPVDQAPHSLEDYSPSRRQTQKNHGILWGV